MRLNRVRWYRAPGVVFLSAALIVGCGSGNNESDGTVEPPELVRSFPPSTVSAPPDAEITQPAQPVAGYGGADLAHAGWRETSGGVGPDGWFVFEPVDPQPASAPVTVVMHGYYEFEGYDSQYEFIRHTVRSGSIVVYPRWQTDVATPCAGPFDVEPCISSSVAGITGALDYLRSDENRVQPELAHASYFGFSFGGVVTANLVNRWESLGIPRPRAVFLDDPHDGGFAGAGEPAVDRPLSGIPSDVHFVCHVGAEGVIADEGKDSSSCNAIHPLLNTVPAANKWLVMTSPDEHGQPALSSEHGVCRSAEGEADAYDWNFCWKVWDALRAAALAGSDLAAELDGAAALADHGEWSDGTPVVPLAVAAAAPVPQ